MTQIEHDRRQLLSATLDKPWPGGMIDSKRGFIRDATPSSVMTRFPSVVEGDRVLVLGHPELGAGLLVKVWMMVETRCEASGEVTRVGWNGMVCFGKAWLVASMMMLSPWDKEPAQ